MGRNVNFYNIILVIGYATYHQGDLSLCLLLVVVKVGEALVVV